MGGTLGAVGSGPGVETGGDDALQPVRVLHLRGRLRELLPTWMV